MSERSRRRRRRQDQEGEPPSLDSEDAEFAQAMAHFDASGAWPAISQQALSEKAPSSSQATISDSRPKEPVVERLDLHGASIVEALERLERFLVESLALDRRRVLVITGRGLRSSAGVPVLRQAVGSWLAREGSLWVRRVETAPPQLGGEGAWLVHLPRSRPR